MRRHLLLGLGLFTVPGAGGLQRPPVNQPAGQATPVGVQPGVQNGVFRRVTIIGSGGELLVYSPTAAAGNLIASVAGAAFTDQYKNIGLAGVASYDQAAGQASALFAAQVLYYTGSLTAGWVQVGGVSLINTNELELDFPHGVVLNTSASASIPLAALSQFPISGSATLATTITAVNALYSALVTAGIIA